MRHSGFASLLLLVAGIVSGVTSCERSTRPVPPVHTLPLAPLDTLLVAQDWQPAWSPDGRRVAYSHGVADPGFGTPGIYYVDVTADTVAAPELVVPAGSPYGAYCSFGPDNRRIVYAWNNDIWVADIYTKEVTRLTTHVDAQRPDWHPHDNVVVYDRFSIYSPADSGNIRILNVDTGEDTPVHTRSGRVIYGGGPAWDPAGKSIVYTHYVRATGGLEIIRVFPDSTEEIQLTNLGWTCEYPKWFADGRAIAFRIGGRGGTNPDFPDWWVISESGSNARPFHDWQNQIEVGPSMAVGPGGSDFVLMRPASGNEHWLSLWIVRFEDDGEVRWRQITGPTGGLAFVSDRPLPGGGH